jgi:ribosomal protein S18 acetylase RimI-like enzyme
MSRLFVNVRRSLPEDGEEISVIEEQMLRFLREFYRPTEKGIANRQRVSRHLTRLAAVADGRVVGTVQYYVKNKRYHLLGMAVREEYRSRGVGRALVDFAVKLARAKRSTAVRISTVKETGNVPIFERLGFRVINETPDNHFIGVNGEPVIDVEMEMMVD